MKRGMLNKESNKHRIIYESHPTTTSIRQYIY